MLFGGTNNIFVDCIYVELSYIQEYIKTGVQCITLYIPHLHIKEILHLFILQSNYLLYLFLYELIFCTKKPQKVQNVEGSLNYILYNMKDIGPHY